MHSRRRALVRGLWAIGLASTACLAMAQGDRFPARPIQIVSTAPPGSQSDVLLRFLGAEVGRNIGQPVVIVTQASAAGTIGADQARRAAPDGYTLILGGNTTMAANVHLVKNLSYDPLRDFEPITLVSANALVLVVRASLPIKTLQDLIAYARERPDKLNYGVGNSGNKVAVGLLQSLTGISALEVPYKGASQAMLELVAGRLDFMISDPLVADAFLRQGTLRALAVTGPVPLPSMRGLPTMAQAGVPGYQEITTFLALYAPRGTPKGIIDALNGAFVKVIDSPVGQAEYARLGLAPRTSTPPALAAFTKEQIAVWAHLAKVSGLQPE